MLRVNSERKVAAVMYDNQNEVIFLSSKQVDLLCQLEILEERLDIYEQLHQQQVRLGESHLFRLGIPPEIVENFLSGDWLKTVEVYKETYNSLYRIERRLCELTK